MNNLMTKSFLNYVDLKKQAELDMETNVLSDAERGKLNPTDQHNLSLFFQEVETIKSQMEEIRILFQELQSLNEEAKSTHSSKILRGLRDRMDSDTIDILRKVKSLNTRLASLDQQNANNRRISVSCGEGSAVDRARVTVTNGLKMKFKDMINDFTVLREKIMVNHKEGLIRKYFNATGEVPSEEIVDKLLSGSTKIEVFEGKLGGSDVEEKERYEVVKVIQKSLEKLHQVFLDMAVLIEKQGEDIDDIEKNVAKAGDFISGGTNSLYYAQMIKRKNKNWVCWVWAVGFIILLVCLISLIALA